MKSYSSPESEQNLEDEKSDTVSEAKIISDTQDETSSRAVSEEVAKIVETSNTEETETVETIKENTTENDLPSPSVSFDVKEKPSRSPLPNISTPPQSRPPERPSANWGFGQQFSVEEYDTDPGFDSRRGHQGDLLVLSNDFQCVNKLATTDFFKLLHFYHDFSHFVQKFT